MGSQIKADDFWNSVDTFREVLLREQKIKHVVQSCAEREVAGASSADKVKLNECFRHSHDSPNSQDR